MKNFFLIFILFVACAPKTSTPMPIVLTPAQTMTPTERVTETATATATLSATVTNTPVLCDPLIETCRVIHPFPLRRPFTAPENLKFDPTYLFGSTQNGKARPHHGIEFQNGFGSAVLAVADGEVVVAGDDLKNLYGPENNFYGNLVVIKHSVSEMDTPLFSLYGHLSEVDAVVGTFVHAGDVIGKVGRSGIAIGPHLHFEVRTNENDYTHSVNPLLWLAPLDVNGVLALRVTDAKGNFITAEVRIQPLGENGQIILTNQYETYAFEILSVNPDFLLKENFVISDLTPGRYRIVVTYKGLNFGERIVEIAPNEVLLAAFEKR